MTGYEYQRAAMRTMNSIEDRMPYGDLITGALGLAGESGEVADIVKKFISQGHELDREHIAEELGDIAWYLALAATAIGYDLDTIFCMNIKKLQERYPNGFEAERSIHREEYAHADH